MGLLDSIIKTAARTATRKVVSKAVDAGLEKAEEAIKNNGQKNNNTAPVQQAAPTQQAAPARQATAAVQQSAPPVQTALVTVNIFKPSDISANQVSFDTFASLPNGDCKEFNCSIMLAEGYHQFDSCAGEIDFSATYAPELTDSSEACYEASRPTLYSGELERRGEDVLNAFFNKGVVKEGCELYRVNSDLFEYKVAWSVNGTRTVSYCYKPDPSAKYYAQLGAMYPDSIRGSEKEALTLRQLNLMVATFARKER